MSMDDLIGWFRDVLDQLEQAALRAAEVRPGGAAWTYRTDWGPGESSGDPWLMFGHFPDERLLLEIGYGEDDALRPAEAVHAALHGPAAVLAEIASKRRILDEIVPALEGYEWDAVAERSTTEQLVRLLASPYDAWPGYRPEWRPQP